MDQMLQYQKVETDEKYEPTAQTKLIGHAV